MSFMNSIDISGSGLTAQRLMMDVISSNIANVNTTRTPDGGPYKRQSPVFAGGKQKFIIPGMDGGNSNLEVVGQGVKVIGILKDQAPPKLVYNPQHPDANQQGYVAMPNINIVTEMVDMIAASRAYEANVTAINSAKNMAMKALEIGRG